MDVSRAGESFTFPSDTLGGLETNVTGQPEHQRLMCHATDTTVFWLCHPESGIQKLVVDLFPLNA
jgi:hypothetical protein